MKIINLICKFDKNGRSFKRENVLVSSAFSIIMHHLRIHSQCGIWPILDSFFMHYIHQQHMRNSIFKLQSSIQQKVADNEKTFIYQQLSKTSIDLAKRS